MKITPELRMERLHNPVQPAGAHRYMGHAYKMCIRIGGLWQLTAFILFGVEAFFGIRKVLTTQRYADKNAKAFLLGHKRSLCPFLNYRKERMVMYVRKSINRFELC